jgi:hypothetical protein
VDYSLLLAIDTLAYLSAATSTGRYSATASFSRGSSKSAVASIPLCLARRALFFSLSPIRFCNHDRSRTKTELHWDNLEPKEPRRQNGTSRHHACYITRQFPVLEFASSPSSAATRCGLSCVFGLTCVFFSVFSVFGPTTGGQARSSWLTWAPRFVH